MTEWRLSVQQTERPQQRRPAPAATAELPVRKFRVREILSRLWPTLHPYRLSMSVAAGLIALVAVALAVMPLFTKYVIDVTIPRHSLKLAVVAMGIFLAIQGLRMVLWYVAQLRVLWIKEKVLFELRAMVFAHLQQLGLRFHGQYAPSFLYDRIFSQSLNGTAGFLLAFFQQVMVYLPGMLFSLGFCLYLSPGMTLVIAVGAVGYVVTARLMTPRIYHKTRDWMEVANQIAQDITDKLRGAKTIQSFAMEARIQEELEERLWPMQLKCLDGQIETLRLNFVTEGLNYLITAVVLVVGVYAILRWRLAIGTLVAFVAYEAMLVNMVQALVNVYGQFMTMRVGFDQLYSVLDMRSSVKENPSAKLPAPLRGELAFDRVTFGYDREPILREMSFTVPFGQTVALVGRSGAGKTTVANLLMRFFDPERGRLTLDGIDVRELPLRSYRALFGVVHQDPFLFNDTIEVNLRYVNPAASEAELWEALARAQAADFVRQLPGGLQHQVGEGGGQLSGGQRQRIAIARCLLNDPRILILDEATSALDSETEAAVQYAFEELFAGRTAFIIAHRLGTIRRAHRVLVLDEGRLVEEGTFESLLAQQGVFHRLHAIATGGSLSGTGREEAGFG